MSAQERAQQSLSQLDKEVSSFAVHMLQTRSGTRCESRCWNVRPGRH
jgi:hypothetical protein